MHPDFADKVKEWEGPMSKPMATQVSEMGPLLCPEQYDAACNATGV